jgi:hypothetical protein
MSQCDFVANVEVFILRRLMAGLRKTSSCARGIEAQGRWGRGNLHSMITFELARESADLSRGVVGVVKGGWAR